MPTLERWLLGLLLGAATLGAPPASADERSRLEKARDHLTDIWRNGASDIYLPLGTHHLRSAYERSKIESYQEQPFGLGYGRSKFDEDGDWHGVFAMGFQDSHFKPNYVAGYGYQTFWRPAADWRVGAGVSTFVMLRQDIGHYAPIPGMLPMGSIGYKNFALEATYVPGGHGVGNVFFLLGHFQLQ